jgi:hypothetical protein
MPSSLETALVRQLTQGLLRLFRRYGTRKLTDRTTGALYTYIARLQTPSVDVSARTDTSEIKEIAELMVSDLRLEQVALVDGTQLLYRHARRFAEVCEVKAGIRLSPEARHDLHNLLQDGIRRMYAAGDYRYPVRIAEAQLALAMLFATLAQARRSTPKLALAVSGTDFAAAKKKLCPVYPF